VAPSWLNKIQTRSKKCSPPPLTPRSFGNCVIAIVNAAPALKPTKTVSLMKLTSEDRLRAQAITQITATSRAVSMAISAARCVSPAAMSSSDAPTSMEIADVGPIASWREVPNNA
jgi:hypothetical protein